MSNNGYWLLKPLKDDFSSGVIVELTPDGVAYVWPVEPQIGMFPVSNEPDQDYEALLEDGDFIETNAFYHGIIDFMLHSLYSPDKYEVYVIGEYESIRSCRASLVKKKTGELYD